MRFLLLLMPALLAAQTYDIVLQVLTIGPGFGSGIPGRLRQTVTVTDDAEAQVSFTLDLSKKEGP